MLDRNHTETVAASNIYSLAERRERENVRRAFAAVSAAVLHFPADVAATNLRRAHNQRVTTETNEHRAAMQRLDAAMVETFEVFAKFAECPSDATYAAVMRALS